MKYENNIENYGEILGMFPCGLLAGNSYKDEEIFILLNEDKEEIKELKDDKDFGDIEGHQYIEFRMGWYAENPYYRYGGRKFKYMRFTLDNIESFFKSVETMKRKLIQKRLIAKDGTVIIKNKRNFR